MTAQDGTVSQAVEGGGQEICCPNCGETFTVGRFYRVKWDAREEAVLREMRGKGKTYGQIAMRLNRSRNSVASKCRSIGMQAQ